MIYENLKKPKIEKIEVSVSFINGPKVEINGESDKVYKVKFINHKTNDTLYQSKIEANMWCASSIKYFIPWRIEIYEEESGKKVFEHLYNAKNKRVYVHFGSKAIGDTLAWIPYIEEFQKEHECEMVCSTFHNSWLSPKYKNIEFTPVGKVVHNLYAMYEIGWFLTSEKTIDFEKNPTDFKQFPLQKTATDILGLSYKEIKPKIQVNKLKPNYKLDYVVIAPHGSKHASYWNNVGGWQKVINFLNKNKYKVLVISKESLGDKWHNSKLGGKLNNIVDRSGDYSLQKRFTDIKNAKAFIGIGSGLTWASWALDVPTVLISGFSEKFSEMSDCYRIAAPRNVCSGCYNTHQLDPSDWEWCPHHKDTPRHFECSTSIQPESVINVLKEVLNIY